MIDYSKTKKKAKPKANIEQKSLATLNVQLAQDSFSDFQKDILLMEAKAKDFMVIDNETVKQATEIGTNAKKLGKLIEKKKKEITEVPSEFVKSIGNFCKNFTKPLKRIEDDIRIKITIYNEKEKDKRIKTEALARKEKEKLQQQLNETAKKEGVKAPIVPDIVHPKVDTVTRTDKAGSSYQRKIWTHEIIDAEKIPREYLMPNEKAIGEAIKMGVRQIDGVRIFERVTTVLKTA